MVAEDKTATILPTNIKVFIDESGRAPFNYWLKKQNIATQHYVMTKLSRVTQGKTVRVKSYGTIGGIVLSYPTKIRIYYGLDDNNTILLLGGDSTRQSNDIMKAKTHWNNYKALKKGDCNV